MTDSLAPSVAGAPAPATVPPFDQVGVAIAPGDDLVVRMPGILLVVAVDAVTTPAPASPKLGGWGAAPVAAPAAMPVGDMRVGELVDLCRRVSVAGSRAPGRRLHDELRTWLPTVSDLPSFALVAATEEGLAVALVGRGVAEVPDLGLRLTPADGERLEDGTPFLDQLVDWPPAALRLWAGSTVDKAPHALADLEAGAVPGAAAFLAPASSPAPPPMPDARSTTTIVRLPPPEPLSPLPDATSPPVTAGAPLPAPPPRKTADRGRAAPGHHHAGHERAGHEHAGHEHAGHEQAGHEQAAHEPAQPGAVAGAVNGVDDATLVVAAPPAVQSPAPVRSASLLIPPDETAREPLPLVS